jgi:hypothetical protein
MTNIQLALQFEERREAPRTDVGGRYMLQLDPGDGRERLTCAILDYSVTGVRLELPREIELPREVQVVIGQIAHNARIVWRQSAIIGVDFIDEHHSIV